jgi:hypothetical protein
LVFLAENAKQRASQVGRHVDRRDGQILRELIGAHYHATAPAVDRSVYVKVRRDNHSLAASGAESDDANLAVVIRQ